MENLNFASLRLELLPTEPVLLPAYKGSTLRGGFGHALKKVCCLIKDTECAACLLKESLRLYKKGAKIALQFLKLYSYN